MSRLLLTAAAALCLLGFSDAFGQGVGYGWQSRSGSFGIGVGVGGYPGYGYPSYGGTAYPGPNQLLYYGYGSRYHPSASPNFEVPDLLNDPYFRAQHKFDSHFPGRYSRRPPLVLRGSVPQSWQPAMRGGR